jgi:uncharacterized protein (TIGR03437 family)
MNSRLLKLTILSLFSAAFLMFELRGARVIANGGGPPNGLTSAPGEQNCATSGCHASFEVNSGPGTLAIAGLPASYSPNQEIELSVTLNQANRVVYGFQITAVDDQGRKAGEIILTEPQRTQTASENVAGQLRQYVTHTFPGINPNAMNQNRWTMRWKAPSQSIGRVTFYAAGNAGNGNGATSGDFIYTTSASLPPATLSAVASVSAASFAADGALAGESIASAFGAGLAANTVVATTTPLPIFLDDTQIKLRDATGAELNVPLFFVSPSQINYLVPETAAIGAATVTVRRNGADVARGPATITSVAPGLFAANANGQGVAAAVMLRRNAAGQDAFEPVARLNPATNRFEAIPIDLGSSTDQLFLLLFGTAFRNRGSLSAVSCTMGGINAEIIFAGPQGLLAGLDQANIRIPRGLAGRGSVDIVFKADNKTANTVTINIK